MLAVAHISGLLKHFSFVSLPAAKSRMSHWSLLFSLVKLHERWYRKIFFVGDLLPGSRDCSRRYLIVLEEFKSPGPGVPLSLLFISSSSAKAVNSFF